MLRASGVCAGFIEFEMAAMVEGRYAKTANRSVVGIMTEFSFMAEVHREQQGADDLVALALWPSGMPCGPLRKRHGFPDRELDALVASWSGDRADRDRRS